MSFNVILKCNYSDDNVLNKQCATLSTVSGTLKTTTSILSPVIEIVGEIPTTCNYMEIPAFNRSYFIDDIRSTGNNRFEISAHVDVLTTYQNEIKACTGIIARQETLWNLYVDDGSFKVYQNPMLTIKKFPSGFNTQEFVLAIAGS